MMTKEVMVTIAGFHMAENDEDTIEMVHVGEYYERNGTHYILFEERMEGISEPVKNRIKIKENKVEMQKRGPVAARMVFEAHKSQSSTYTIPYGSFLIEIYTVDVGLQVEEDRILTTASYELNVNGVHCASCNVRILAESRKTFRL